MNRCAKRMTSCGGLALMMMFLNGCATVVSSRCPEIPAYSAKMQREAEMEFRLAGPNVRTLVRDYSKLRDACRAVGR